MATLASTTASRERLIATLNHKQPDRIPIDFGGTATTGVHVSCVAALRDYYGLEKRPVRVHEPFQMLGTLEEDLQDAMGLDVIGAVCAHYHVWLPGRRLEGMAIERAGSPGSRGFQYDGRYRREHVDLPEGDMTVPPSGRMPSGGYFFDCIVRQGPIDEDKLNPEDNLEDFSSISQADLDHIVGATRAAAASGRGVIATFGGTALGDIALVPAPFLKHPKGIRDITEWYVSTSSRQNYVHKVFERQCEIALENLEKIHDAIGDIVQAVFICGTDFGTQTSAFCSVKTFNNLYFPYYKKVNDWIHSRTQWKTFKHSCGAVSKFLPSFIDAGIDILNPVQCSATGMDPEQLKASFGDRLVFWGGGVDTQRVLPFGTPAQVREQVLRRCEIFAPGGGFVFNTIHNVQAATPVENIVAMLDAVHEFNRRK